jgi:hypothetical protein
VAETASRVRSQNPTHAPSRLRALLHSVRIMKRKSFRDRRIQVPASLIEPIAARESNLAQASSGIGQTGLRRKRLFIIKQVSRSGTDKKIRRVLIFDNHPDSLRLVFEGGAISHHDLPKSRHVSSWELIIVSILTIGGLVGMFWPLF